MPQITPVYFAPDIDTAWSSHPGALSAINALAPLQSGIYGSVGTAAYLSALTGTDHLTAYLFRQVAGTVRLLTFRKQNIDEYDSSASRTNRGTSYSASTTDWSAAAWGNQIIACNYLNNTQSSTGGAFADLGGSSPKARYVAANLNFVMLADVDDSGSNVYSDMVWWCALQNPASWTPSIATEAGNVRLLDAPGPIRQLIAYRDTFVAFKDNAIFVGEYVGPSFVFSWRLVSNRVGCIAPKSVVELDGKLYFLHSSGFWEFDGQTLRNVGLPVFQSFLTANNYMAGGIGGAAAPGGVNISGVATVQAAADDIEGLVWWLATYTTTLSSTGTAVLYCYNARSQKWGAHQVNTTASSAVAACMVRANTTDIQSFKAATTTRFLMVWNGSGGATSDMQGVKYPATTTDSSVASFTTGVFGSNDGSVTLERLHHATTTGTSDDSAIVATITPYKSENKNKTAGTASTGAVNTEFDHVDGIVNARYVTVAYTWSASKTVLLKGLAPAGPGFKR